MTVRRFRSFAKINLGLEVLGRLHDGYHELKTLFASVSHHDVIEIGNIPRGITIRCAHPGVPEDETNLAHQAAEAMLRRSGRRSGVAITIQKRIAVGGGLGGGSSNAATVLRALDLVFGLGLGPAGLLETARSLGADVPYFLVGGPALGLGRGDEIKPLKMKLPGRVLLVQGNGGVGTAAVFRRFAALGGPPPRPSALDAFLRSEGTGDDASVRRRLRALRNDLEPAARAESSEVSALAERVRRIGRKNSALHTAMSGSGSSFFLIFSDALSQRAAASAFADEGDVAIPCRFLSRRSYVNRLEMKA